MKKELIICLVGESGSGKSTIADILEKKGYKNIDTYTTRPQRFPGEKGHIFVSDSHKGTITFRLNNGYYKDIAYISEFNGELYWSTKEQYMGNGKSVYALNPNGAEILCSNVHDAEIVVVYVKCNENIRKVRMQNRLGLHQMDHCENKKNMIRQVENRIQSEKDEYRLFRCDYVIDTNGKLEDTFNSVERLLQIIEANTNWYEEKIIT